MTPGRDAEQGPWRHSAEWGGKEEWGQGSRWRSRAKGHGKAMTPREGSGAVP